MIKQGAFDECHIKANLNTCSVTLFAEKNMRSTKPYGSVTIFAKKVKMNMLG